MCNNIGDVALMKISRETNCFYDLCNVTQDMLLVNS